MSLLADFVTTIQSLTWRNVAQITALLIVAVPAYAVWWSLNDGQDAVIDWRSGERVIGTVGSSCLLLEFRQSGVRRQRIVQNLGLDGEVDISLSAGAFKPFGASEAAAECSKLQALKRRLDNGD